MAEKDVQNETLEASFKLTQVGVRGSRKPIFVERPSREVHLTGNIDASVDLPANQKGSHLSRNIEAINEIVENCTRKPVSSLEELAVHLCSSLLERHEYANRAEADISADYFLERRTASGIKSIESYRISGGATLFRKGDKDSRKRVIVTVQGMTVCPCALELIREDLRASGKIDDDLVMGIPLASHNQRNTTRLRLVMPLDCEVEADDMIDIVEESMSSPTFEMLKRPDEEDVVKNAHLKPRFVEDVVREVLKGVLGRYSELPKDVQVNVFSESEESIHKHNAFASRSATLSELLESED